MLQSYCIKRFLCCMMFGIVLVLVVFFLRFFFLGFDVFEVFFLVLGFGVFLVLVWILGLRFLVNLLIVFNYILDSCFCRVFLSIEIVVGFQRLMFVLFMVFMRFCRNLNVFGDGELGKVGLFFQIFFFIIVLCIRVIVVNLFSGEMIIVDMSVW